MILVVDATVAVHAALAGAWIPALQAATLTAPTLVSSEVVAATRQLEYRNEISADQADSAIDWFSRATMDLHPSQDLMREALVLARKLGWAKTYDAEYVVLARRLGCILVTVDARLRATAASVIRVVGPTEVS